MAEGTLPSFDPRFGGRYDTKTVTQAVSGLSAHRIVTVAGTEDGGILGGDVMLDLPRSKVTNQASVNKFGQNDDVDTSDEDIWTGGGDWTAPTAARIHQIVSTSTDDDSATGNGAKTVRVWGLTSWSAAEVSEDITMDGQVNVATSNSYVIIHRMQVLTSGSTGPNAGAITATADTDATVTARIEIGAGQTAMAIYGIPSTQNFYVTQMRVEVNRIATAAYFEATLRVNPEPGDNAVTWLVKEYLTAVSTGQTTAVRSYIPYFRVDGPAIIKVRGQATTNSRVAATFDGILVTE